MRKWIGLVTATLCVLSSSLRADEAPAEPAAVENVAAPVPPEADTDADMQKAPTQVGKAATDSTQTAKTSNVAKYALAAGAVAIGITAIILVSNSR